MGDEVRVWNFVNDDDETMALHLVGDEVRQVFTTDGAVVADDIAYAGPGAEEWVRRALVDYRSSWTEV